MQPNDPAGAAPPGALPQPGAVLLGKYRVERVIGVGGMGAVVAARHLQLDERVAIKFLLPQMLAHEEIVQRFLREARSAIKIRSEHCVRVLDVGTLENSAPYMVMEYLEGQDLAAVVEKHRPLPISDTVDWVLQAGEALAEAHVLGIIHRDLKPANLFLTRRADGTPSVKVLDFGISKQTASGADAGVTKTQAVLGSPRYMSPEQMRSTRDVDARADVWALGAVIHELVAGEPPFDAETMTALCAAILQDPPRPVRVSRPDVPPQLEAAIAGALQKDRDRRFQNVAQLAMALAPFGSQSARASADRIARVLGVPTGVPGGVPLPTASGPRTMQIDPRMASNPAFGSQPYGPPPPMAATTGGSGSVTADIGRRPGNAPFIVAGIVGFLVVAGLVTAGFVGFKRHSASDTSSASSGAETPTQPAAEPPPTQPASTPPAVPSVVLTEPTAPTAPAATTSSAPPATAPATAPGTRPGNAPFGVPPRGVPGVRGQPTGAPPQAKPPSNNGNPFGDDRKG
jgi:serine/threonine-protein kinase